eukprot:Rmarinus@m.312
MMMGEDVRSLIIEEQPPPSRQKLYTSQHKGRIMEEQAKRKTGSAKTFGKHTNKPDPNNFLKKSGNENVPATSGHVAPFVRPVGSTGRKAAVPKESPVFGLVSNKNYVTANAIENILSAPKNRGKGQTNYLKKKDYGKIPEYLERNKEEIEKEKEIIRQMHQQQQNELADRFVLLSVEQRSALVDKLKDSYDRTMMEFQAIPVILDTDSKKQRKEALEAKLAGIEKEIRKFETAHDIFVDRFS